VVLRSINSVKKSAGQGESSLVKASKGYFKKIFLFFLSMNSKDFLRFGAGFDRQNGLTSFAQAH
jgi:hypothetical protein